MLLTDGCITLGDITFPVVDAVTGIVFSDYGFTMVFFAKQISLSTNQPS
jgi:hypothetical protein